MSAFPKLIEILIKTKYMIKRDVKKTERQEYVSYQTHGQTDCDVAQSAIPCAEDACRSETSCGEIIWSTARRVETAPAGVTMCSTRPE
jgi:hypothetical protein